MSNVIWKVYDVERVVSLNGLDNVITRVLWGAEKFAQTIQVKQDPVVTAEDWKQRSGYVTLSAPSTDSFISFENVTEDNAIAWAKAALGNAEVIAIETDIRDRVVEATTNFAGEKKLWGVPWR